MKNTPVSKRITQSIFLILLTLSIFACKEESKSDDNIQPKDIPLMFVELSPNTIIIDIDNDMVTDIVYLDTIVEFGIPGDVLYLNAVYAKSYNPNIKISWGKAYYPVSESLLAKDTIVDSSLEWGDKFLIWGQHPWMTYGRDPDYIGIMYVKSTDTLYGWIYKPYNYFSEYAMDTSAITNNLKVYTGQIYKH